MNWFKSLKIANDYAEEHSAPDRSNASPMYDLSGTYPDDFYSTEGIRYYGDGSSYDTVSWSIINSAKGRPKATVKVYRAVPLVINNNDKIKDLQNQKAYILRTGKIPTYINTNLDKSKYYDQISTELDNIVNQESQNTENQKRIGINTGDWVTIIPSYANEHGKASLRGRYRVLSKTVRAKDLYTYGDSLHEWGYDPL